MATCALETVAARRSGAPGTPEGRAAAGAEGGVRVAPSALMERLRRQRGQLVEAGGLPGRRRGSRGGGDGTGGRIRGGFRASGARVEQGGVDRQPGGLVQG